MRAGRPALDFFPEPSPTSLNPREVLGLPKKGLRLGLSKLGLPGLCPVSPFFEGGFPY